MQNNYTLWQERPSIPAPLTSLITWQPTQWTSLLRALPTHEWIMHTTQVRVDYRYVMAVSGAAMGMDLLVQDDDLEMLERSRQTLSLYVWAATLPTVRQAVVRSFRVVEGRCLAANYEDITDFVLALPAKQQQWTLLHPAYLDTAPFEAWRQHIQDLSVLPTQFSPRIFVDGEVNTVSIAHATLAAHLPGVKKVRQSNSMENVLPQIAAQQKVTAFLKFWGASIPVTVENTPDHYKVYFRNVEAARPRYMNGLTRLAHLNQYVFYLWLHGIPYEAWSATKETTYG